MKTSNKLLLGLLALILLTITIVMIVVRVEFFKISDNVFKPTGKMAELKLHVPNFNQLEVEDQIKVNYTQDTIDGVVVKADSSQLKLVVAEVRNGKLFLSIKDQVDLSEPILVEVTSDSINDVRLSTGGIFNTQKDMKVNTFTANGSTGSVFSVAGRFNQIKMQMSVGCVANFSGKCTDLNVSGQAGSIFNASDLEAEIGSFSASAGAIMNVNVTKEISVDANAGSIVKCSGKAVGKKINVSSGAQFIN